MEHNSQHNTEPGDLGDLTGLIYSLSKLANTGEAIVVAYQQGDTEQANDLVDAIVAELMEQDKEYQSNLAALREARTAKGGEHPELIARNRKIYAHYLHIVTNELGLPNESMLAKIKNAQDVVNGHIEGAQSVGEVLERLGLVSIDGETETPRYHWNEELFPEETTEKWKAYLATVCDHVRISRSVTPETQDDVMRADLTRTMAHNAVTKDVMIVLDGLRKLDPSWDFAKTRQLVAGIRESTYPEGINVKAKEVQELLKTNGRALNALKTLSQ